MRRRSTRQFVETSEPRNIVKTTTAPVCCGASSGMGAAVSSSRFGCPLKSTLSVCRKSVYLGTFSWPAKAALMAARCSSDNGRSCIRLAIASSLRSLQQCPSGRVQHS